MTDDDEPITRGELRRWVLAAICGAALGAVVAMAMMEALR